MSDTTIDTLQLNIESNSSSAYLEIDKLATSLTKLATSSKSINTVAKRLTALNTALAGLKTSSSGLSNLKTISDALNGLGGVASAKGLNSTLNALKKIPEITKQLNSNTLNKFAKEMKVLSNILDPVANKFTIIGAGLKNFDKAMNKSITITERASKSKKSFGSIFKNVIAVISSYNIGGYVSKWVTSINEYIENMNLFKVSMGEFYEEAKEYAEMLEEKMGIDSSEWMRNQGVFKSMATGFGLANDKAYELSKGMTELSYDMSSFYNIPIEEALTKMRSALAGEIEPLRALGISLTEAQLKEMALAKGITKSVEAMTESEKATLRYTAIVEKASAQGVIGDFARTLESPANALRILQQQITQLGRALGSVFLPIITQVMPYIQAFVKVVTDAVKKLAVLFKFEMPKWDASSWDTGSAGISDTATALGDATAKAKEYKKSLQGFDELNIIPAQQEASGGSGSGVGAGGDLGLDIKSVWDEGLISSITTQAEELAEKMKDALWYVGAIGLGILGWKIGNFITDVMKANKELKFTKFLAESMKGMTLGIGIALSIAGLTIQIKGIVDTIKEGLNFNNLMEMLGGSGLLVAGATLIGKTFGKTMIGGAIGGIVAGIPLFVTGIYDALVNGLNWMNGLLIPLGSTMAGAGIGAIIGSLGGPIGTGLGALIGLAVGLITDFGIWVYQNWDSLVQWFSQGLDNIGQFFSFTWTSITNVWSAVSTWFDTTVIQPVVGFFSNMWNSISTTASNCWNSIVAFFTPAFNWFSQLFGSIKQTMSDVFYNIGVIASGCWTIIKTAWGIASSWFNTYIIQPVSTFFTNLWNGIKATATNCWNGIKSVFSTIGGWINTNIISPVGNYFSNLWNGFLQKGKDAWNGIKSVFSAVGTFFSNTFKNAWQGIVKIFSVGGEIFKNIKDGILSAFKSVVNGIIRGLNNVIAVPFNGINTALRTVKNISILGLTPFSGIRTISVPQIPLLAGGGMPDTGQMFIARESGPELVGQIGNRTAVANQEQIIAGISQGVYEAMVRASGNGKEITINVNSILDGKEVGKSVVKYHNGVVQQTGLSPLMI